MNSREHYRPISKEILSDNWGLLTKHEFELLRRNGEWQRQTRETYDRGNGATCLLHNPQTDQVLLTRQFRLPVFLNGGLHSMIETPAGLLDGARADERMRKELIEETGFEVDTLTHLFDVYMSPGSVTEYLAFFKGTYSASDQTGDGGGTFEEGEDIEVMQVALTEAMRMIENGAICDGKTIILLQHLFINTLVKRAETY
ncbi:NUDIX domain-containing protein [Labrenzia sp. DG1229]|uniref:NUDIX domain-containing protein n=1 Tax=Labrenzia sp. DG1229 TaxID=681847 RepID=UPI00048E01D3|nr:NUDIX domain-containing protein [Labrenzia sp. DG1229]